MNADCKRLLVSSGKGSILILVLSLLITCMLWMFCPGVKNIKDVSFIDLVNEGNPSQFILIDARTEYDFEKGHIPGAINLPMKSVLELKNNNASQRTKEIMAKIESAKLPVLTYCSSSTCHDSLILARFLSSRISKVVSNYPGGYEEWQKTQDVLGN